MHHPLDRAVASDLSYRVFEKRRELGELSLRGVDCTAQPLYPVPSFVVNRRRFIADVEMGGDSACPNPPSRALGERER